jgi:DNA-3-methyladenine glycosylase II
VELTIALPPAYRPDDTLHFHSRDAAGVAEQVSADGLRKGVMLDGVPVLLDVRLTTAGALCTIDADGALTDNMQAAAQDALHGMLGLKIDPAPFLAAVQVDPLLGPVAARQSGLRVVQSASIFEALSWAIIGQQINLSFAIALRRTFILQAGRQHSSGLWCYPDAASAARLDPDLLLTRKFSRSKAETLLRLATLADSGQLDLDANADLERTGAALLGVKGFGPWTVY